jgi:hypothetical protein
MQLMMKLGSRQPRGKGRFKAAIGTTEMYKFYCFKYFKENIISVKYQPHAKIFLSFVAMNALKGEDKDSSNYGGNVKINNRVGRISEYDNYIGQGFQNRIKNTEVVASVMIKHNLFVDFMYQKRKDSYFKDEIESIYSFGLRWNMVRRQFLF